MAWTTPKTMGNEPTLYTDWNTHVRDNLVYLKSAAESRAANIEVFAVATPLSVGDGKRYFGPAPSLLAGYNLTKVIITVFAKSTAGLPTVQLARGRQLDAITAHAWVDMLLTAVTIDINEFSSLYATTAAVVNAANDDILEGDLFRVDVDAAGTGATGLWLTAEFAKA